MKTSLGSIRDLNRRIEKCDIISTDKKVGMPKKKSE